MLIKYPDQPHISPIKEDKDGNIYELDHSYHYESEQIKLIVFKGFKYDGASVPRWAWTISRITPDGLLRAAALVHDCLYLANGAGVNYEGAPFNLKVYDSFYTRKDADKIFLEIMRECGVGKFRSWLAYKAVRIGGRFYRDF